jgi:hypothetical protein
MSAPSVVLVESFVAYGRQQLACGHIIDKGDTLIDLRFGNDITSRAISLCSECFAAVGRLGRSASLAASTST